MDEDSMDDVVVDTSTMTDMNETLSTEYSCLEDRQWWKFLVFSLSVLSFSIIVIVVPRILLAICEGPRTKKTGKPSTRSKAEVAILTEPTLYTNVQNWAEDLISGNTATGRFLVVFAFVCSIAALVLYIVDTHSHEEEACVDWKDSITIQIDFSLAVFFVVYFFIRFLAADDKLAFVLSIESLVDYFTVPPVFLSVYLGRTWHGLRFLRALIILNLSDVLVYIRVMSTSSSIRLTKLASIFVSVILTSAGFCHLLENSGDPWRNFENAHDPYLSYGDCIYYMFVTMSTVGYGDIYPQTDMGKVFIVLYMMGALAMFANFVPEMGRLIGDRPKYGGEYHPDGRQFIVVCGNINYESVQTFLADFFHPARDDVDVEVVFLNKAEPSLDFEGLLKREATRVQYFRGSMLNAYDLQRIHIDQAAACLVLANKFSEEPDAEDAANIMRVISLKNFCEDTRVIIQLMMYHNKAYLLNIPGWDWRRDDQAVCLNELKLGFIAQSCLAPGFSTLVSNLIVMTSPDDFKDIPKWKRDYFNSCNKFIIAETLSPTFVGMTFSKVAEICYVKLNLLLLAIEARKYEGGNISINPKNKEIQPNAIGIFLTESADSAKRAWFYCRECHKNVKSELQIQTCACKKNAVKLLEHNGTKKFRQGKGNPLVDQFLKDQVKYVTESPSNANSSGDASKDTSKQQQGDQKPKRVRKKRDNLRPKSGDNLLEQCTMQFDSTGMYHWCPSRDISECLMDRQEAAMTVLQDHIIVAVFADEDSPLIGLRNLVMPIRASNIAYNELLHVVIVGNVEYLKNEWRLLQNLPKISVLNGSPLSRADLRAVKIDMCRMVVILSAKRIPSRVEPVLADKEVILTFLNIQAMKFGPDESDSEDEEDVDDPVRAALINGDLKKTAASQSSFSVNSQNPAKKLGVALPEMTKRRRKNSLIDDMSSGQPVTPKSKRIPMIVDLAFASNVRFLDEHELHLDDVQLYKTLPYAAGQALARGILDSLMSTTYFNASALRLIRLWVTGGATIELELALAEGAGLRGGYSTQETMKNRDRFRVEKLPLAGSVFSHMAEKGLPFGALFSMAALKYGMLCIGLFRLKGDDFDPNKPPDPNGIRIVISAPDKNIPLMKSDIAFMLVQYEGEQPSPAVS